jgi:hypothetical protein
MKISAETKVAISHIARDAGSAKSELIDLLRELESKPGTKGAAKQLDNIIGRLESWQAKYAA